MRATWRLAKVLGWVALGVALGCEPTEVVVVRAEQDVSADGGAGDPDPDACRSPGVTAVGVDGTERSACAAALASRWFRHALCTCEDASVLSFDSDGFDSSLGLHSPGQPGGPVGVDGNWTGLTSAASVADSLTIAGASTARFLLSLTTASDLLVQGALSVTGRLQVGRDARVRGALTATAGTIGRDLYQPDGALTLGAVEVDGLTLVDDVQIEPPCGCSRDLLDVAQTVARGWERNDNAQLGLNAQILRVSEVLDLELPCGRYFLEGASELPPGSLRVTGRVALFIAGDLAPPEDLLLDLAEGAELDLFVSGNLDLTHAPSWGERARPAALRLYVGGSSPIRLEHDLAAALYAPGAPVFSGSSERAVFGALFVRSLDAVSLDVHHDRALLRDCAEEPAAR